MNTSKVLIVEDDRIEATLLRQRLINIGFYDIHTVSTGLDAIESVKTMEPDIVLMDIVIEGEKDGIDVAEEIRSICYAPVIYLTAHPDDATFQRAKKTNPDGYLLKPIDDRSLRFSIEMALSRHETEKKLNRLVSAVEQASEALVITGADLKIEYVNQSFEQMVGMMRSDLIGKSIQTLKDTKIDSDFYLQLWKKALAGESWGGRLNGKRHDGSIYTEEISITPVKDHSGRTIDIVAVSRDATNEIMLEKQLRQAQKMEAIGALAGGIAHDFNNILTPIFGYSEMALDFASTNEETKKCIAQILSAAKRAKELVQQILAFSRQREEELVLVYIQPVLKEALQLLRASLPANIEMRSAIDAECGPVTAAPSQIHQIIMNLCTNAYHAMRQRGGVLDVKLSEIEITDGDSRSGVDLKQGKYVLLSVGDTGNGMEKTILERIFDPFFTTKGPEGTGMGLAVVHGIVKSYHGTINVYSETGKGSVFSVYLPRSEGIYELPNATAPEVEPKGKGRILFVDDEPQITIMAKRMLESLGYQVEIFNRPIEALNLFREDPYAFDLLITDQTMPGMLGSELAREFIHARSSIPVILCTGFSEAMSEKKARACGIKAFLMKPIIRSDIANAIHKALGNHPNS